MLAYFAALSVLASAALGAITPTSPDSTTKVDVGGTVNALWNVDTTGTWKNMFVQLMTGDNLNMIPLATITSGIDGTKASSMSFLAPNVSPYSQIYFLQFTNGGDVSTATWTTCFTIAGKDGSTTPPTNSTVYSGQPVQWGTGTLLDSGITVVSGAGTVASANGTITSTVANATSTTVTLNTAPTTISGLKTTSTTSTSSTTSVSASASKSSASAAASSSKSAAGRLEVAGWVAVLGAALGLVGL